MTPRIALLFLLLAGSPGCPAEPATGPVDPTWDRDTCEQCRMTLGDRRFAAQVRMASDGRLRHFDDLGCALAWLEDQPGENAEASEIHVRALAGSGWLDARTARYVAGQRSPMGYGLGALPDDESARTSGAESFESVRALLREQESQRHGAQPAP